VAAAAAVVVVDAFLWDASPALFKVGKLTCTQSWLNRFSFLGGISNGAGTRDLATVGLLDTFRAWRESDGVGGSGDRAIEGAARSTPSAERLGSATR
jgi:hypothetical protein